MLRIWFFWTPHLSTQVLQDFLNSSDMEVTFVVTGEDKAVGRHQAITPNNEVKMLALQHNIPIFQPAKVRNNTEFLEQVSAFDADYFVVVAYGKILPAELLAIPKKYCLNIHGSILPKYRGASPIQAVLLNGESETWVTIMVMNEKMDEGDIIDIAKINISWSETTETLFQKFGEISGSFAIEAIRNLENGSRKPNPQDHSLATYCSKISKEDGKLDFQKNAEELYHQWQAFTPWPGVFTEYEGKRLVIEECSPHPQPLSPRERGANSPSETKGWHPAKTDDGLVWTILRLPDKTVGIVCAKWILTLERVKLEWKKSQSIKEFLNGHQNFIGAIL